ncbi:DUF2194 domain-containing protein [Lachnotalea glycerini]|uniref:DUF2194 domain-containing protein n=1 Tax=Lachnotalea glycerini TaxID=1763509 RepID=A0A371JC46_9FIRM|nr:DUF2194 domain-containing protein [Lachnotalea glycerini]RDY30334.1 DUF2194 domain-containing protein [Lachnotalea glycerini]
MKYYNKFWVIFILNIICVLVVQLTRTDTKSSYAVTAMSKVVKEEGVNAIESSGLVPTNNKTLIIYNDQSTPLVSQASQLKDRLANMKIESQLVKDIDLYQVSIEQYKAIIIMSDDWENTLGNQLYELIRYASNGGNLLFGVVPNSTEGFYKGIYRSLGIMTYGSYETIEGFQFEKELMTGSKGMSFIDQEDYDNICLNVAVDDQCQVYMSSAGTNANIPLLWSRACGDGNIVVFNSTGLGGRYFAGIFAGAMTVLEDDLLYPIINAKTIYIDDFPAPQFNIESDVIKQNYSRTVKEFYRDIWWPDMQKAASLYKYNYTGLFITSYENNVDEYHISPASNFEYYGNSLLKNGFEIGLHGYNHQPLALKGYIPEKMGYKPWKSEDDMVKAISVLNNYAKTLFPYAKLTVYVPPSNYLSPEGREAVVKAVPDLSVISGVYEADESEYVQDFTIEEDGIAEFPRLTSGMWNDVTTRLQYMCGITMYGVFSHFIHPDDILDEERGKDADWDTLYTNYTELLKGVNNAAPLRSLKASEAGEALKVYHYLKVELEYGDSYVKGACDNFYGEAYFYLRTSKTPLAVDDSCVIEKADKKNGEFFYVVTVKKPEFEIKLEDK